MEKQFASFGKRLIAMVIDLILLIALILGIGYLGSNFFVQINKISWLFGFVVTFSYFGILNSQIGTGQTLGKRIVNIKVVNSQNKCIELKRALLRSFVFVLIFSLNHLLKYSYNLPMFLLIFSLQISIFLSLFYFYFINKKSRQSIHDLVAKTYVINTTADIKDLRFTSYYKKSLHFLVILILVFTLFTGLISYEGIDFYKNCLNISKIVSKVNGVSYLKSVDIEEENIEIEAFLEGDFNAQEVQTKIAGRVFNEYFKSKGIEGKNINIRLITGYELMLGHYYLEEKEISYLKSKLENMSK